MLVDSPKIAQTIFVVDVSNCSYRAYYAHKELRTKLGLPSGHVFGAIQILLKRFQEFNTPTCLIFCYDGCNSKKDRLELYPGYKGNRIPHDFCPVPDVKELCLTLPGLHIEQDNMEGDDAIAWAVSLTVPKETIVFTGDDDLISLMSNKTVKVYSPNKGRVVEEADWLKEYHVKDPAKIYIAKALFGDSSDNIKGVERLIKKQVEPILNDNRCVDIKSFYDMLETKPESMSDKMYQKTLEAKERVFINYEVIKPRINFDKSAVKRVIKAKENKDRLLELLNKYECYSVLDQVESIYR